MPSTTLSMGSLFDEDDNYRCDNIAARIESTKAISNLYFNEDHSGIVRVGFKRGKGSLIHVNLEEGE